MIRKLFLIFIVLPMCICLACNSGEKDKIAKGNEIATKIENFKRDNGKLPVSLSEIGIQEIEESTIHYKKESDEAFLLWFGTSIGESVTYDSNTKQWK